MCSILYVCWFEVLQGLFDVRLCGGLFVCGFVHVDNRCGHMSISCFGQNVQFGLGFVIGQKMHF